MGEDGQSGPLSKAQRTAAQKLTALVGSLFPEREVGDTTRYLSLVLGLGVGEAASESIHLLFAARRVVELLSERGPLLLVFEDVHWADDSLLDLVDYLVTHVRDHPAAFLALARPEFLETRPNWGAGMIGHTMLPLEPLTAGEATEVVGALVAGADASTVAKVIETAEGNPLFIEELVLALSDDAAGAELPATVRAAIAARIDALPTDARTALLHASVIGQSFWRGVLEGIGQRGTCDREAQHEKSEQSHSTGDPIRPSATPPQRRAFIGRPSRTRRDCL
jgi:predicted ATPase